MHVRWYSGSAWLLFKARSLPPDVCSDAYSAFGSVLGHRDLCRRGSCRFLCFVTLTRCNFLSVCTVYS